MTTEAPATPTHRRHYDWQDQPPPAAEERRNPWTLGLTKRFVDPVTGEPLSREEMQLAVLGAIDAEITALGPDIRAKVKGYKSLKRKRKHLYKQYNKLQAKFEGARLLRSKRFSRVPLYIAGTSLLKFITFFPLCLYAGKLTVTGIYDALWETGEQINAFGATWIAIGVAIVIWAIIARAQRGGRSPYAGMLLGAVFIGVGCAILYEINKYHPTLNGHQIVNNTMFWHWLVRDDATRHLLYRAWPEGLIGGLYWAYFNWDQLKRTANKHWYDSLFKWMGYSSLADEDPAETWQLVVLPIFVIGFALPATLLLYYTAVKHESGVHAFIHTYIPWKDVNAFPNPKNQAVLDKIMDTVALSWPIWLIGLLSANFYGRTAAFGVLGDLQQVQAWRRIVKKGGSLHGALSFWQMNGKQKRVTQEWETGARLAGELIPRTDERLPEDVDEAAAAYAQYHLKQVGPTVTILFRMVIASQFILIPLGAFFLYGPPSKGV